MWWSAEPNRVLLALACRFALSPSVFHYEQACYGLIKVWFRLNAAIE